MQKNGGGPFVLGGVNERQLPAKLAALTFMGPGGHVLHRPVKSDILK